MIPFKLSKQKVTGGHLSRKLGGNLSFKKIK